MDNTTPLGIKGLRVFNALVASTNHITYSGEIDAYLGLRIRYSLGIAGNDGPVYVTGDYAISFPDLDRSTVEQLTDRLVEAISVSISHGIIAEITNFEN